MNIHVPSRIPKGAISLRALVNDPTQGAVWKRVVRHEPLLAKHIRTNMRTMRLAKIIPTWEALMQTSYFKQMTGFLDPIEVAKYQAWWETIFEISDGEDLHKNKALFMLAVITREKLRRVYAKEMLLDARKYGLSEAEEARIKDAALSRFEDLTRF
jgi:hypothetical protein